MKKKKKILGIQSMLIGFDDFQEIEWTILIRRIRDTWDT